MAGMKKSLIYFALLFLLCGSPAITGIPSASAGNPYSGTYCSDTNKIFWFIQTSDVHVGEAGDQDSRNLEWLVTQAKSVIQPSFIVVSGDLTDSTNGNFMGYPDGPHQEEWNLYKSILAGRVDAGSYYDLPGNHDAYNDKYFSYYLANSIQGKASHSTQISWTRTLGLEKYHFLGVNTADNTGAPFSLFWPYGDYAGLDTAELGFIQSELYLNRDAALTLIFGHHPLAATGNSTDTYLYYGRDQFVSFLQTYGASLYGYGHTHEAGESFYTQNISPGIYYFNVASLGKSSENQYSLIAIDCNGISSIIETINTWPVVLITAPMDKYLGGASTPFVYQVPASASNPLRALVFDPNPVSSVQYRVNGGTAYPMTPVTGNSHLWTAAWNASSLPAGDQTIEVWASTASGTRGNFITVSVKPQEQLKLHGSGMLTGTYQTSGTKRNKVTTFVQKATFAQGDLVVFQLKITDASTSTPVANATAEISISGPQAAVLVTGPSNTDGLAEAKWQTSAPNKRAAGGTSTGTYTGALTKISASGYVWDGGTLNVSFFVNPK